MFNGQRLKSLREASGQTQDELAHALGVANQQIWRWESGKNDPSGTMIAHMAQIYNVSSDFLLNLVNEPKPTTETLSEFEVSLISSLRRGKLQNVLQLLSDWMNKEDIRVVRRLRVPKSNIAEAYLTNISCDYPTELSRKKKQVEDLEFDPEQT